MEDTNSTTTTKANYIPAVGRRKSASARIRLIVGGKGSIIINEKPLSEYFPTQALQDIVKKPLVAVGQDKTMDVTVKVVGGGKHGQAEAVQLGIARSLVASNDELRKSLKSIGMLSRDARVKERKKFGKKKARRAPQWSKR